MRLYFMEKFMTINYENAEGFLFLQNILRRAKDRRYLIRFKINLKLMFD